MNFWVSFGRWWRKKAQYGTHWVRIFVICWYLKYSCICTTKSFGKSSIFACYVNWNVLFQYHLLLVLQLRSIFAPHKYFLLVRLLYSYKLCRCTALLHYWIDRERLSLTASNKAAKISSHIKSLIICRFLSEMSYSSVENMTIMLTLTFDAVSFVLLLLFLCIVAVVYPLPYRCLWSFQQNPKSIKVTGMLYFLCYNDEIIR